MRYFIIAGEASGDLHGANLIKNLYDADKDAVINFRSSERMAAVMGFADVARKAGTIFRALSECKKEILDFSPDVVILIDYPGFNLRIAKWAHKKGLKVFYYIAPKVWASREWRIKKLRKYVDRLFIIFPFEKAYFESKGIPYIYCGNPLVDAVDASPALAQSHEDFCNANGLAPGTKFIAMLAGSRLGEVKSMMPLLKDTAAIMHAKQQFKDWQFIIAGAPGRQMEDYGDYDHTYIKVLFGQTQNIVHAAQAAVINSGTASLEAALIGTPQVVAYKISKAAFLFAKHFLVKCKYISLGNLCLDRLAFRELYDPNRGSAQECSPKVIAAELERLVTDKNYRAAMLDNYAAIRSSLGSSGASAAVAKAMVSFCSRRCCSPD